MKISLLKNNPNIVCSIDASTNNFAYAIFNGKSLIKFEKIEFSGATVFDKVLSVVTKTFDAFRNVEIDAAVIEHAVFMNSPKTMYELSMIQGAILAGLALASKAKLYSTNPIAWQAFIGNKVLNKEEKLLLRSQHPDRSDSWYKKQEREIRKQRTISFVNINYDIDIIDNDIADAIGIGHYAINNWEKLGY